jgi:hypothetical protein
VKPKIIAALVLNLFLLSTLSVSVSVNDAPVEKYFTPLESIQSVIASTENTTFSFNEAVVLQSEYGGLCPQLAIDSNGYAHIVYLDVGSQGLEIRYASNTGGQWTNQLVDGPFDSWAISSADREIWIAVDSTDKIHIVYNTFYGCKYATNRGAELGKWLVSTLSQGDNLVIVKMVVIDANNTLHLVYVDNKDNSIHYANMTTSGSFINETIPNMVSSNYGSDFAIKIGSKGALHIACINQRGNETYVEYLHKIGGVWNREIVDNSLQFQPPYSYVDLELDMSGNPCILYNWFGSRYLVQLRYVEQGSAGWKTTILFEGYYGIFVSMTMNNDIAHIIYSTTWNIETSTGTLNYAYGRGVNFTKQEVGYEAGAGRFSVVLNDAGKVHFVFPSWVEQSGSKPARKHILVYAAATSRMPSALSCSISKDTITQGESIVVSGSLNVTLSGKTVTLTYKKPDESILNKTVTTGSDGSYSDSYTPDAAGTWSVTASWVGDSTHNGATSSTRSLTVNSVTFILFTPFGIALLGGAIILIIVIVVVLMRGKSKKL